MKKTFLMLLTVLAGIISAHADNGVTVGAVAIPQGGSGTIDIELNNDDYEFTAFTFKLTLPEGLSFVLNNSGKPTFEKTDRFDESHTVSSAVSGQVGSFGCLSGEKAAIKGTSGTLLRIYVQADAGLAIGTELDATLSELTFSTTSVTEVPFSDVNIDVTIAENRIVFDETSSFLPVYTAGEKGNVRMKRTIHADEWSTIVLPFTLTKANAEAAFGADVQLAEFSGFEVDYGDDDENVTPLGITMNFTPYTMSARKSLTGGKPFLIRTKSAVTQFEADDVTLVDAVTDVEKPDEYGTSGKMTGTFVKSVIPEDGLFLSGNEFWYSTGATNVKAFRAWFELSAVLDKDTNFGAKIRFSIENESTAIKDVKMKNTQQKGWYSLDGRKLVGKPTEKGTYINNGKKVVIK